MTAIISKRVEDAARELLAAAPGLPSRADMAVELEDGIAAQARGYYAPDEDERLRESYHRYLAVRVSLWETVKALLPYVDGEEKAGREDFLRSYGIALCAAAMLMRTGSFLLDIADNRPVVWKKLDEAEPRYGIERKSFTVIYQGLTAPKIIAKYRKSWRFYHRHARDIHAALSGPLYAQVSDLLRAEAPLVQTGLLSWITRRLSFRRYSYKRRHISAFRKTLFALFQMSGSQIAELKQPFVKRPGAGKRVGEVARKRALEIARPGDVFITRHDDALSNVFLPGFWPHAALYIGTQSQRAAIDVPLIDRAKHHDADACVFLESKKDGVLFRPASDTLHLDAFVILRPTLPMDAIGASLTRGMTHVGKLYDFSFDFSSADRLACTELIYRSYHMAAGLDFRLDTLAGRKCLSAESLMNQMLASGGFDVLALYGINGDDWLYDNSARTALLGTYDHEASAGER